MPTDDELAEAAFAILDRLLRPASLIQVGGFRPPDTWLTSSFGGRFVAAPHEAWPKWSGEPMIPLLQVRIDELPYCPLALEGVALFNVFFATHDLPLDGPLENGRGWLLRSYTNLDELQPIEANQDLGVRPFAARWTTANREAPDWFDIPGIHSLTPNEMTALRSLPDGIERCQERYPSSTGTKIGGWPAFIQGGFPYDEFVFQIGPESKSRWMWADNGRCYFCITGGKWVMLWDSF